MSKKDNHAQRIDCLLVPGFPMMAYASVMEPFRAANQLAGRHLYDWRHVGLEGAVVAASSGVEIRVDGTVAAPSRADMLLVCAGGNPAGFHYPALSAWLRRGAAGGARIGGVSAGPYLLAQAGVLDGYRCTIHWEHMPAFVETFPDMRVEGGLYVIDRTRLTCAGGIAGLDLAIALIAQDHGPELATAVSDWYIGSGARGGEASDGSRAQRASLSERYRVHSPALLRALSMMETHLEDPLDRTQLAEISGVSLRQLDRLCAVQLGRSLSEQYHAIRLGRADALLRQSSLTVTEIAVACGYRSPAHFSRRFRARYGCAPRLRRGRIAP